MAHSSDNVGCATLWVCEPQCISRPILLRPNRSSSLSSLSRMQRCPVCRMSRLFLRDSYQVKLARATVLL